MTINIIAIILALVALIITVIGFFASLKFYRDGMNLQSKANNALSKIAEKADSIHSQVGGMFDKMLDAAIGRSDLKRNFEGIDEQLNSTALKLVDSFVQLSAVGEKERQSLSSVVNEQVGLIKERVQETRESAEQWVESQMHDHIIDNIARVLDVIDSSKHPLTLEQISEFAYMNKILVDRLLSVLAEGNQIKVERDPKTNIRLFSPKIVLESES